MVLASVCVQVLVFVLVLACSYFTQARTDVFYVDAGIHFSHMGSTCPYEAPCSLVRALDLVKDGDIIQVNNGTYSLARPLNVRISNITISGSDISMPVFNCTEADTALVFSNTKNIILTNLKFENCYIAVNFTKDPALLDHEVGLSEDSVFVDNVHASKCNTGFSFEGDFQPNIVVGNSHLECSVASINAISSQIYVHNTKFTTGPGITVAASLLTIENSTFSSINSYIARYDCGAIRATDESTLRVISTAFNAISCESEYPIVGCSGSCMAGGAIFTASSDVYIYNSSFVNTLADYGGAIAITDPYSAEIDSCYFSNLHAYAEEARGGALFFAYLGADQMGSNVTVKVSNSQFEMCESKQFGGAIALTKLMLAAENCTFSYNRAVEGGAIHHNSDRQMTTNDSFINCTFMYNKANSGGAVSSSGYFERNVFMYNKATVGDGGAMWSSGKTFKLVDSYFAYNFANGDGGGVYSESVSSTVFNTRFHYNNATGYSGGAVMSYKHSFNLPVGDTNIYFSEFVGNMAGSAGALSTKTASAVLRNVSFVDNRQLSLTSTRPIVDLDTIFSYYPDDCGLVYNAFFGGNVSLDTNSKTGIIFYPPFTGLYENDTLENNETCWIHIGPYPLTKDAIPSPSHFKEISAIVISIFGVICLAVAFYIYRKRRTKPRSNFYEEHSGEDMTFLLSTPEKPSDDSTNECYVTGLEIGTRIGSGAFGTVYEGKWNGAKVAVKTITGSDYSGLFREANVLRNLRHPNIVQFLGIYKSEKSEFFMVTEFVAGGNLEEVLRGVTGKLPPHDLIKIAVDIAAGMRLLEQTGVIHRDLAARNILVDNSRQGDFIIKVADFGMSKITEQYYTAAKNTLFPVKWAAPEVILYNKFSSKSDIWAMGILLWEIASFGQLPYHSMTNKEASEWVMAGNRLSFPTSMSPRVAILAQKCWSTKPEDRPTFVDVFAELSEALIEEGGPVYLDSPRSSISDPLYLYQDGMILGGEEIDEDGDSLSGCKGEDLNQDDVVYGNMGECTNKGGSLYSDLGATETKKGGSLYSDFGEPAPKKDSLYADLGEPGIQTGISSSNGNPRAYQYELMPLKDHRAIAISQD